jgi:hypothetical protein
MKLSIHTFFATLIIMITSCSKSGGGGTTNVDCSNNTSNSFAAHVSPIIQNTCAVSSCHAAGSINGVGPLTNYTQISSVASSIRTAVNSGSMPKNSSLTSSQKASIICWIDAGALNN